MSRTSLLLIERFRVDRALAGVSPSADISSGCTLGYALRPTSSRNVDLQPIGREVSVHPGVGHNCSMFYAQFCIPGSRGFTVFGNFFSQTFVLAGA